VIKRYLNKIVRDLSWVVVLNLVNYVSSFVIAVIISRYLGVEGLGVYAFITASSSVLYLVSDFGLTTLLVRKINEDPAASLKFIRDVNSVKVLICLVLLLFILAAVFLDIKGFSWIFFIGCAAAIPRLIQTSYEAAIRAKLIQKIPTIIRSGNSFLQIVLAVILMDSGYGLFWLFVMLLFTESVTVLFFRYWVFKVNPAAFPAGAAAFKDIQRCFKEGLPIFMTNFFSFAIPRTNIILLEYLRSAVSVGIFSAGVRFINAAGLLTGALFNTYYPLISSIKENLAVKIALTKTLLKYALVSGLIISLSMFLLSDLLIDLTFRIEEAKPVLKITAFSVIPVFSYTVIRPFLYSVYKESFLVKLFTAAFLFNLILSIILIVSHDYIGCAVVTLVIDYLIMVSEIFYFYRKSNNQIRGN
jgi:O-antigen/teichoic acid export membrane protein